MSIEQNDIESLIGKNLSGEITVEEKAALDVWFDRAAENQGYYRQLETLFEKTSALRHREKFDTDIAWKKMQDKLAQRKAQQASVKLYWRIAASVVILVSAGFFVYQKLFIPQDVIRLASVQQASDNILPDGTAVFLNKNTSLAYEYDPIKKIRTTKLKGEAYFKIAAQEDKDFTLRIGDVIIKDIGTSFNVKAYPDSDSIEVYVESGEVIFYSSDNSGIRLTAQETGIYNEILKTFSKRIDPDQNTLAYKTQILVFDNSKMSDVVEAINEVYETKLKLDNAQLGNCRITVTFRHETIDMIAEVIAETLSLTLEKTEHEITLKGNGCAN